MECHPYIGMKATSRDVTGTIVAIGIASEECSEYSLHFTSAVLLLADGKHKEVAMDSLIVDPAEAAARLAKHS